MAKARAILRRRKAVTNIRKITRTMQLVATARYQKAYRRALATRPYAAKLSELARILSARAGRIDDPLLRKHTRDDRAVVLVLTSNRGLCGGYNMSLLRLAISKCNELVGEGKTVHLEVSGKKGIGYLKFLGRAMDRTYTQFDFHIRFAEVAEIAERYIQAYRRNELDAVYVVYMQFISAGVQRPRVLELLPLTSVAPETDGAEPAEKHDAWRYEFSPRPEVLLGELLPLSLKTQLFDSFTAAVVSEQAARMVAMKSATDAASDMIKMLNNYYNRARQTQITLELLDLMGGAEALK